MEQHELVDQRPDWFKHEDADGLRFSEIDREPNRLGMLGDQRLDGKAALREQLERLDVPRFPLSGGDLIAAGLKPGPALGADNERALRGILKLSDDEIRRLEQSRIVY